MAQKTIKEYFSSQKKKASPPGKRRKFNALDAGIGTTSSHAKEKRQSASSDDRSPPQHASAADATADRSGLRRIGVSNTRTGTPTTTTSRRTTATLKLKEQATVVVAAPHVEKAGGVALPKTKSPTPVGKANARVSVGLQSDAGASRRPSDPPLSNFSVNTPFLPPSAAQPSPVDSNDARPDCKGSAPDDCKEDLPPRPLSVTDPGAASIASTVQPTPVDSRDSPTKPEASMVAVPPGATLPHTPNGSASASRPSTSLGVKLPSPRFCAESSSSINQRESPIQKSLQRGPGHKSETFSSAISLKGKQLASEVTHRATSGAGKSTSATHPSVTTGHAHRDKAVQEQSTDAPPVVTSATGPGFDLPPRYKELERMFSHCETVVANAHNCCQRCTFKKLKDAVEKISGRTFSASTLGQIKTVSPNAYHVRLESRNPTGACRNDEIVIAANLNASSASNTSHEVPDCSDRSGGTQKFTASHFRIRKHQFHCNLVDIVKQHHEAFLSKQCRPLAFPKGRQITAWHPDFDLKAVPDIPVAQLPQVKQQAPPSAIDVLRGKQDLGLPEKMLAGLRKIQSQVDSVQQRQQTESAGPPGADADLQPFPRPVGSAGSAAAAGNPDVTPLTGNQALIAKARSALALLAKAKEEVDQPLRTWMKETSSNDPPERTADEGLRGVSQSLVEKIRQKEKLKAVIAMTLRPEEKEEQAMLERLPNVASILKTAFVIEKKSSLPWDVVVRKAQADPQLSLSQVSAEKHVRFLLRVVPEWIKETKVSKGVYITLNMDMEVSAVKQFINKALEEFKRNVAGI